MEPAGIEPAVFRMPSEQHWRALSSFPLVDGPKNCFYVYTPINYDI